MPEPTGTPAPGYTRPDIGAIVLPAAYSPVITEPSARSTRPCSSVVTPPLVPRSVGTMLDRVERRLVDDAEARVRPVVVRPHHLHDQQVPRRLAAVEALVDAAPGEAVELVDARHERVGGDPDLARRALRGCRRAQHAGRHPLVDVEPTVDLRLDRELPERVGVVDLPLVEHPVGRDVRHRRRLGGRATISCPARS